MHSRTFEKLFASRRSADGPSIDDEGCSRVRERGAVDVHASTRVSSCTGATLPVYRPGILKLISRFITGTPCAWLLFSSPHGISRANAAAEFFVTLATPRVATPRNCCRI